jgi:hypothetical protein
MQGWYAETFEREMGCTAAELVRWLPGASGGRAIELRADAALISIGDGQLRLTWKTMPPRQIALLRMPRLAVSFSFAKVDADLRQQVMRFFDLFTQRGGG